MKNLTLGVVVLAALTMTGCALPQKTWTQNGNLASSRDEFECKRDARQMSTYGDTYNPFMYQDHFNDCMRSKGYR